jgi:CubicO group peptidase (beta-lactamase class C family)
MQQNSLENNLQREIDSLVSKNQDIFNVVLGVTRANGDFFWSGAAGYADADRTEEMTVDTPIFIASITKMFTGAATMLLEEQKRLSLDDPISKYLPADLIQDIHRYKGQDYIDQLRVYHLISQTSGLPDYFTEKPKGGWSIFDRLIVEGDFGWNLEQIMEITKYDLSPKFPPEPKSQEKSGKAAYYSDTNYQLLGAILESVTQQSLDEIFSELIIEPLELSATYLHGYTEQPATPASIYYKTRAFQLDKAMTSFGPDGGMVSTVSDSLKFIQHFMQGKLFANPSTLERMKNWKKIFFPLQYGFGLMRFKLPRIFSPFSPSPALIGHSGSTSAFLFYSESDQIYIAGTLNQVQNQGRPFRVMLKMIKMINEALS